MRPYSPLILSIFAAMLGFVTPVGADSPLLREAIGLNGDAMFIDSGAPGMVLVVVRGQDTVIEGYGETTKGNGRKPDGKSLLRLGSITKVFAGELLASLATEGKVHLTDPLRLYGAGTSVPKFGDREITLLDLATHSAGLPREMGSAPPNAPLFSWPTRADRWSWLSKYSLAWEPGTVGAYSNIGFDLLADALVAASGKSYSELLKERITGPLGMADTVFNPTKEQCERLMTGSGLGGTAPCVDTEENAGSGGLYSTAEDMAKWLRHNLATSDPATWPVLALAHAVYLPRQAMTAAIGFDEAGPMAGIGLGWIIMAAQGHLPMIVQKTGGVPGFMTYIAFAPGKDVGAFVAVTRVDFAMFPGLTAAVNALIANLVTR
jgi:serine-type D-Ala-D-Ala carboxypeptidase/endopeptidase